MNLRLSPLRAAGNANLKFTPSPLGGEGGPQPALSPAGAGRVGESLSNQFQITFMEPLLLLTQVAAGQVNENVFQAGLARGEMQQVHVSRL